MVFPSADEKRVSCLWLARLEYGDPTRTACHLTVAVLGDGAASPMTNMFVDEGLCSGVFLSGDTFRIGYRQVWFDDVATAR